MLKNGPELWDEILQAAGGDAIIAGGAIRDHQLGVIPKDIDVFLPNHPGPEISAPGREYCPPPYDKREEYSAFNNLVELHDYMLHDQIQVQFICLPIEPADWSIEALLDTFDFGLTQMAYVGGRKIHMTEAAEQDLANKTLTLLRDDRIGRTRMRADRFIYKNPEFTLKGFPDA